MSVGKIGTLCKVCIDVLIDVLMEKKYHFRHRHDFSVNGYLTLPYFPALSFTLNGRRALRDAVCPSDIVCSGSQPFVL